MKKIKLQERTFVWPAEPNLSDSWLAGDITRSTIFNGMSLLLGAHEARLMRTFNMVLKEVRDPDVRSDVHLLIAQESRHYRAHDGFNSGLMTKDAKLQTFFDNLRGRHFKETEEASFAGMLAYLLFTEHLFGCMGRAFLSRKDFFEGADSNNAALWIYHSIEELEHTRVSFDVVNDCLGKDGVQKLLSGAVSRNLGYDNCNIFEAPELQAKLTDKLRWTFLSHLVDSLTSATMRGAGIRDLYDYYFMNEGSVLYSRDAGWFDLFVDGWHPSVRYEEDVRLIEHWDGYLRRQGFVQ